MTPLALMPPLLGWVGLGGAMGLIVYHVSMPASPPAAARKPPSVYNDASSKAGKAQQTKRSMQGTA